MLLTSTSVLLLLLLLVENSYEKCLSRDYGYGSTVCVCNAEHCDTISRPQKLDDPQFYIYTSNKAGLRFNSEIGYFSTAALTNNNNQIIINSDLKYQTILGFGGAFTDSTGININSLEKNVQEKLLESYFSTNGIEYSMCRVPIGGTDFSTHGYSYDDGEADPELKNFALADEDYEYKIPLIKEALTLTNNTLRLFASAWTAPKWMKTNRKYNGLGFLKIKYYQTWADYFVKFLDSYKNKGIEFWGITTGNEPHIGIIKMELNHVGWIALTTAIWISKNLGPALRNSDHSDIKLMILDDARLFLPFFADLTLAFNRTSSYVDGIAVHWYFDTIMPPEVLTVTHKHFPEKFILSTEACIMDVDDGSVPLGDWKGAEKYAEDIIEILQNWGGGWIDWNMALDLQGGPTYIDNYVNSPIIVNATANEFYKQPMYYSLGHFSKFVPQNSVRIDASSDLDENVKVVAFQTPDNGTAIIILNLGEAVPVSLVDDTKGTAQIKISERSITTLLYW